MMDLDDLWLRDGDERFARFLRRLGFDHDEAMGIAQKHRPPTEIVPMRDGSGFVETPRRPLVNVPPMPVAGRLRETAEPLPIPPPEGPQYKGEPIIVTEERDMTEQITRGERGYRDR